MITNKEDFSRVRKTRLELLEERIINAENFVVELKKDLINDSNGEIFKIQEMLNDLKKLKYYEINDNRITEEVDKLSNSALITINNDKLKIIKENESLRIGMMEKDEYIKKLQEEIYNKKISLDSCQQKEKELIEYNFLLEEKVKNYKSKAFGYDIAKKFDMYQNKMRNEKKLNNQIDPNRNKTVEDDNMAYNFWEKQSLSHRNPSKLEDFAKQKDLWIGNSSSNIEKLMYDINGNNNTNKNSGLNSNMRKYSPFILNK